MICFCLFSLVLLPCQVSKLALRGACFPVHRLNTAKPKAFSLDCLKNAITVAFVPTSREAVFCDSLFQVKVVFAACTSLFFKYVLFYLL